MTISFFFDRFSNKKRHFLEAEARNLILDIYKCPKMKNQAEDGRKKVKIPSCDHYALKIDFYPNYCVTITFLSGMGGSAKKLSLLAWSRCRADIFHLIYEILIIRQFACNYCTFSTKEVFM